MFMLKIIFEIILKIYTFLNSQLKKKMTSLYAYHRGKMHCETIYHDIDIASSYCRALNVVIIQLYIIN